MMPEPIKTFIARFARLPSLGPRLATRLAFYLASLTPAALADLSGAIEALATLDTCPRCFALKLTDAPTCAVCADPARDRRTVAIVERPTDLEAIERTGRYRGRYLVLGELLERGLLEPGHRERLAHLAGQIRGEVDGRIDELVIAVGLHTFGDFAAELIRGEFRDCAKRITRIGRGIPTGGEIEFADEETVRSALERRA